MKTFAKEFLKDGLPVESRSLFLGAFGKHPGWDDHIDDIGLETESLVTAKQIIYVEGIGGSIGHWEQLDWTAQIAFDHAFIWRRERQIIVGRLWASSDGKKRTRYPMIIGAHCAGVTLSVVIETFSVWFEELRTRAMATKSADEVREMVFQFREGLRDWLPNAQKPEMTELPDPESTLAEFGFSLEDEDLLKAINSVRCSKFAAGRYTSRVGLTPEQFRFIAPSTAPMQSLHFWDLIFATQIDPTVPVLLIKPVQQYWMDAIVGEPQPANFFCLRASPRALALTGNTASDLPVSLQDEARTILLAALGAETPSFRGGK